MIDRTHRFHGYGSLRSVYQHGQTARGPLLALRYRLNPRRSSYRIAVVVSRKVSKSAVVRNRIRRRVYEIVRENEPQLTQPFDLVVTVFNEEVASQDHVQLSQTIISLLKKAKVWAVSASVPPVRRDIVFPKERKI